MNWPYHADQAIKKVKVKSVLIRCYLGVPSSLGTKNMKSNLPLWCSCAMLMPEKHHKLKYIYFLPIKLRGKGWSQPRSWGILDGSVVSLKRTWDFLLKEKKRRRERDVWEGKAVFFFFLIKITSTGKAQKARMAESGNKDSARNTCPYTKNQKLD